SSYKAPARRLTGRVARRCFNGSIPSRPRPPMKDTRKERELLWKLIKNIRFAMFTTRHGNGHLHSRPMTTQNKGLEADESLWFFMSKRGDPVDDLKADPVVN